MQFATADHLCVRCISVMAERRRPQERYEMGPRANEEHQEADRNNLALTFTGSQCRAVSGRYPTVCVNDNGKIIEMHQPSIGLLWSNSFHYQVGTLLADCTVRWAQDETTSELDAGKFAAVALNKTNLVIVVYEDSRRVYYHVGSLDVVRDKIEWSGHGQISWGRYPAVALNNKGEAVVAYESNLGYRTFYRTAQLPASGEKNITEVNWSQEEGRLFTEGATELSLAVNQTGCIIAAAKGSGTRILFRLGKMQTANEGANQFSINWEANVPCSLSSNRCPVVSLDNDRNVVVAYQSRSARQLFYRVGKISLDHKNIAWLHEPRNYDMGCNPTIALCNNGKWFEEHETNSAYRGHKLYYRVGNLRDDYAVLGGVKSKPNPENGDHEDEH